MGKGTWVILCLNMSTFNLGGHHDDIDMQCCVNIDCDLMLTAYEIIRDFLSFTRLEPFRIYIPPICCFLIDYVGVLRSSCTEFHAQRILMEKRSISKVNNKTYILNARRA